MACKHKFYDDLFLEKLDFKPTTLIVGTFNPSWPEGNEASWFYGRTKNNYFWEVLPRLYNETSMLDADINEWKKFCKKHSIAITDLIASINDAEEDNPEHEKILGRYSDSAIANTFKDFSTGHIKLILKISTSINCVYLTRRGQGKVWKKLWRDVEDECDKNGIIKREELLTPSMYARYQYGRDKKKNKTEAVKLEDYILEKWKSKWHT